MRGLDWVALLPNADTFDIFCIQWNPLTETPIRNNTTSSITINMQCVPSSVFGTIL